VFTAKKGVSIGAVAKVIGGGHSVRVEKRQKINRSEKGKRWAQHITENLATKKRTAITQYGQAARPHTG